MPGKQGRRRTSPGGTIESLDVDMNPCEKYTDWITDAATGALSPGREPELLAHVAECDACREGYEHAREIAASVDRGVESLVSGEPSPNFHARLRARIAAERTPARPNWAAWAPIAVGTLTLAALLAVLVSRAPQHNSSPVADNRSEPAPDSSQASNPPAPTISTQTHMPTALSPSRPLRSAHRPATAHEPEIIVPPGQLAAITQFAAAIRSGHIDGDKLLAAEEQTNAPLEIKPLEIVPLVPPQADVAPDATEDSGRP
jgi:hypothetical protein